MAAGATGDFNKHYARSSRRLAATMRRQRSTLTGHVVSRASPTWPGPRDRDRGDQRDGANRRTDGQQVPRHFRLRVTLRHQGDRWLTSDISFVGDAT